MLKIHSSLSGGDFAMRLFDLSEKSDLTIEAVEQSIRAGVIKDPYKNQVRVRPSNLDWNKRGPVDFFDLDFEVEWPVSAVISPMSLSAYQRLFR